MNKDNFIVILYSFAAFIVFVAILYAVFSISPPELGRGIGAALAVPTLWLVKRAKRHREKFKQLQPPRAGMSLALYLRSFSLDGRTFGAPLVLPAGVSIHPLSTEQLVILPLSKTCEVIAVGKPEEEIPELGCRRVYFTNDDWRSGVSQLIQMASVVVLNLTFGGAVVWELERARELLKPHQLLIFLGLQFLRNEEELLRALPAFEVLREFFPKDQTPADLEKALLIRFESDWRPVALCPRIRMKAIDIGATRTINAAMKQALQQMPTDWKRPLTQQEWQTVIPSARMS